VWKSLFSLMWQGKGGTEFFENPTMGEGESYEGIYGKPFGVKTRGEKNE